MNLSTQDVKELLAKRLADAEYWASKNGYEQEALNEILSILKLLISEVK